MACYKTELQSNGDKASSNFKPFLIGNTSDKFSYLDCVIGFIQTHFY